MNRINKGFRQATVTVILAFLSGVVLADGLSNAGFEDGILGDYPLNWNVEDAADSVKVVDGGEAELSAYVDTVIPVVPYRGENMLRLGTPKQQNEKQNIGANTVSQAFVPTGSALTFSFRLFSWDHRQDDMFRFDVCLLDKKDRCDREKEYVVTGVDDLPLSVNTGAATVQTCVTAPCEIIIGDGKRGDLLDTGWMHVKVSGLDENTRVRLEYSVIGGNNNAHASWVYLDDFNTPPVAKFSFDQKGLFDAANNRVALVEGAHVAFIDESYDPDTPDDRIVDWEWWISGTDYYDETVIIREQSPTFIFPDNIDGQVVVNLKVTDSFGASTSVSSGGEFRESDGTVKQIASLEVSNNQPLVRVLNREVLAGEKTQSFGRFIDPGFMDEHTASWNIPGALITQDSQTLTESYQVPSAAIGSVSVTYTAPTSSTDDASLTISDMDGGSTTEVFTVQVLEDANTREPNNDLASPPPELDSGWVYLSTLDRIGDVDIFEVVLPGNVDKELPAGSEVLVKLKELPADYDLVVLSYLPTETSTSTTPWLQTPWLQTPWLQTPWLQTPWLQTPWLQTPWLQTPWLQTSFMEQIPLSDLAKAELAGEDAGGSDLSLAEIGLGQMAGLSIAGFSANRGLEIETVLVRTDLPGTKIYVAVVGNNGAFSQDPYALQIETSKPLDLDTLLGTECNGEPLIQGSHVVTTLTGSASPRTLFVTQKERFDAFNGDGSWTLVETSLARLATIEEFAVLNVDSSVYDAWDTAPCSIEEANRVTSFVREQIVSELSRPGSTVEYVVFIGGDDIIPFRRVPDETTISSEKLYAQDSNLKPGSPLFASMYQGNNLTDDYYVDNQPIIWQGRELYVPKLPVSRLVETPSDIVAGIDAYLDSSQQQIDLSSALVTGYDFFQDGSRLSVANLLDIPADTLISDELDPEQWNLEQLRCELLGEGDQCNATPHDINNINAHFNHYGAISADGYYNNKPDDFLSSLEIWNSGNALTGSLTYTVGCHSGLNVPDGAAYPSSLLGAVDPNLDFPQAMSSRGAVYVGSTGFGLGDDVTIAGTEKLIALFSGELTKGGTVGQALVRAKKSYINSLSTITVYDEKSSIQTTMYGLPMYKLGTDTAAASVATVQALQALQSEPELLFDHVESTTIDGSYFTVNGSEEYQVTAWRPLQPKVVMNLTPNDPVHGVLIRGGAYTEHDNFNPVITKPRQEWELLSSVPAVCLDAFWPSTMASINTLSLPGSIEQSLIVVPGQFRCTSADAPVVSGIQRNITALTYELTGASIDEFTPPSIKEVDLHYVDDASMRISVKASDDSGIERILVLAFENDLIQSFEVDVSNVGGDYYTLENVPFSPAAQLQLQVVDNAGNVANWSAKGVGGKVLEVEAEADTPVSIFSPTTLTGTIMNYNELVQGENKLRLNDIFYRWEFGDGHTEYGKLVEDGVPVYNPDRVTIDNTGTGSYSFTVDHQYQYEPGIDELTAILKVTDSTGAIGVDEFTMSFCADPVGDVFGADPHLDYVTCGTVNQASGITIYLQTNAPVEDSQFRVHLDLDNDGKEDEMLKYNSDNGTVTGMKGLDVSVDGQLVTFSFDLPSNWKGESFQWYAETQDGVSGGTGQGFVDRMPDAGYFTHTMK